jgi:DNA-binding NarL/FixJ family response regulator
VQRALQAGARGYVTRADSAEALLEALLAVLAGERHVSPRVANVLLDTLACGGVDVRNSEAAALSDRELEVFRLLGEGLGTRSVAERLCLSVKTVETHRERIKEKLRLPNGTELQRRAVLYHGTGKQIES